MWAERSHADEDSHHMSDNVNQNCPVFPPTMHHVLNSPQRVSGHQMHLSQGQFGGISYSQRGQINPSHIQLSLTPTELAGLREGYPISVHNPFTAPRKQPVDASTIKCPIVMLKMPARQQTEQSQAAVAVEYQNNPDDGVPYAHPATQFDRTVLQTDGQYSHFCEAQRGRHCGCGRNINQAEQFPQSASQLASPHSYQYGPNSQFQESCVPYFLPHTYQYGQLPQFAASQLRQHSTENEGNQYTLSRNPFIDYPVDTAQTHRQPPMMNYVFLNDMNDPQYVCCDPVEGSGQDNDAFHSSLQGSCSGFSRASASSSFRRANCTSYQLPVKANIQLQERNEIRAHLEPGKLIQICGAPMTGKSTIVRQAIDDAVLSSRGQLVQRHISCKGLSTFQDFLSLVAQTFCPLHSYGPRLDTDTVLNKIHSVVNQSYHVLVFHKCENLKENPHGWQFLEFLMKIVAKPETVPVTVVFTTYKLFLFPRNKSAAFIKIGVLSIKDIITLLQHYVPTRTDLVSYAHILVKNFCFPEAVRLIAEEFLTDEVSRVTPEMLEKKINNDQSFLSQLFESRVQEVETWIPLKCRSFLTHFKHSVANSFTEAHLEYVNSSEMDQVDLDRIKRYLKENHAVLELPTIKRLAVHPLIVYYSMTSRNTEKQLLPAKWFDNTCNRFTYFLGRVLMSAETSMQEHGRKGLVFGGLFQEWPNVRYMIEMALHCNRNTYENFIKVAVSASGFIFKCFQREAESFYWGLYSSARDYGSPCELAVMEAMLGFAVAEGSGKDWVRADHYLTSGIEHLSTFGNSYFLGWALLRKAIILHRQGKYVESLGFFKRARNVLRNVNRWALGEAFSVSEAKIEEEIITQEIHETIPIIFTGHNQLARQRLDKLQDLIQNSYENHPEIAILLNLIGLTEQRGNRDSARALKWYKLSYNERMYWAKFCPESLLAVLNNIGVILFHQESCEEGMKYLYKALDIRRECGWTHYNTGLTLVHVAELNLKMGNFPEAFKQALEAERIFAATVKDHDMRLRINYVLAHLRVVVRQALEAEKNMTIDFDRSLSNQNCCRQTGSLSDARNRDMGGYAEGGQYTQNKLGQEEHETSSNTSEDSVTSSQLFGASECFAGQKYNNNVGTDSSFDHSHRNPKVFPAREDIVRITETKITPCDLQMSAEDYLNRLLTVASEMKGTFSDDGLSIILCSHELAMLLNLGNSPIKFQEHVNALVKFSRENPWTEETGVTNGAGVDSKYRCLIKHKALYTYIMSTPYSNLDMEIFIEHMRTACFTCQFASDVFSTDLWVKEATYCRRERQRKEIMMRGFDRLRVDTLLTENDSARSETVNSNPSIVGKISEEAGLIPDLINLIQEVDSPVQCSTVRNRNQREDSVLPRNDPHTHVTSLQQIPGIPNFNELMSDYSFHGDIYKEIHHPVAVDQEQASRPSDNSFCPSPFVVSRIVDDQKEILHKIQSCRTNCPSSHSAGVEMVDNLSSACVYDRNISSGTKTKAHACPPTQREPVEQSYTGDQDPSWNSEDNLLTQSDRESHDKLQKETSVLRELYQDNFQPSVRASRTVIDSTKQSKTHTHTNIEIFESRQTYTEAVTVGSQTFTDTGHQSIRTDYDQAAHDDLDKSPGQTSRGDSFYRSQPVYQLDTSEKNDQSSSPQSKTSSTPEIEKFSVLDYLIRNGFNVNLSKTDESEVQTNTNQDKSWLNLPTFLQESVEPLSEGHCSVSIREVEVADSIVETHVDSRSGLPGINLPACPPGKPDLAASHPENSSQFYLQHSGQDVHESLSEKQPNVPHPPPPLQCMEVKESLDDSQSTVDSGLDSAYRMNDSTNQSRRGSGSESSHVSQRSRSDSASSSTSSCPHTVAHAPESGYSSQQHLTGARSKSGSIINRPPRNLTAFGHHSTLYRGKGSGAGGHHNQGFSDIIFNVSDNFKTSSGSARDRTESFQAPLSSIHDITQKQGFPGLPDFSQGDILWQSSQEFPEGLKGGSYQNTDNQAAGFSNSLRSGSQPFVVNTNNSLSSREPVEQSWTKTLMPNEYQVKAEEHGLLNIGNIRPELLHLEAQRNQEQHEHSSDCSQEETLSKNAKDSSKN